MSELPSIISDAEFWYGVMSVPALFGALVVMIERKLPVYSMACTMLVGTFALTSASPDQQIVDRAYVRRAAEKSRTMPQLRPLIAQAMKDDRMTLTEYRTIQTRAEAIGDARDAALAAEKAASGEQALKAIEQETGR